MFFWPCLDFTKPGLKIQGASLGLAVYLGAASLLQGLEPPALVCSGRLGPTGLEPSREDALKISAADHTGFQGFLCVSQGPFTKDPGPGTNSPFEVLAVPDLETARMLWACYLPEKGHELLPAIQARYDPPAFAALMDTTPLPLLEFLEKQEQCVTRSIEALIASVNTPVVERLLHTLFALEHRPDRPRRRLDLLLKPLHA